VSIAELLIGVVRQIEDQFGISENSVYGLMDRSSVFRSPLDYALKSSNRSPLDESAQQIGL
jgi:hypothetical protein